MELNLVLKLASGLNIKEIIIVRMKTTIVDVIGMGEIVVDLMYLVTKSIIALIQILWSPTGIVVGILGFGMMASVMVITTTVDVIGMVEIVVEKMSYLQGYANTRIAGTQNVLASIQTSKKIKKRSFF